MPSFMKGTPARLSVVGASLDAWGVRAQVYGINFQYAIVKGDYWDFRNENGAVEITQKVAKLSTVAAAKVSAGGANVISKVINLFT